jgi:hypothetical protein
MTQEAHDGNCRTRPPAEFTTMKHANSNGGNTYRIERRGQSAPVLPTEPEVLTLPVRETMSRAKLRGLVSWEIYRRQQTRLSSFDG